MIKTEINNLKKTKPSSVFRKGKLENIMNILMIKK